MAFPRCPKNTKNIHQPARASTPRGTKEITGQTRHKTIRSLSKRELHHDKQPCVLTTALHQLTSARARFDTQQTLHPRGFTHTIFSCDHQRRHEKRKACVSPSCPPRYFRVTISTDTRIGRAYHIPKPENKKRRKKKKRRSSERRPEKKASRTVGWLLHFSLVTIVHENCPPNAPTRAHQTDL